MRIRHAFVCLLCFCLLPLAALADAYSSVSFDGSAPIRVLSIVPESKTYVEITALARERNWSVQDRLGASVIKVNGKDISDIQHYNGKTYVRAEALGKALGYTLKEKEQGQVLDFWSDVQASEARVRLSFLRGDKLASPTDGYVQLLVSVLVKNLGKQQLVLNTSNFFLTDDKGQKTPCTVDSDFIVKPNEEARLDKIYFHVPKRATQKSLTLQSEDKVLGTTGI